MKITGRKLIPIVAVLIVAVGGSALALTGKEAPKPVDRVADKVTNQRDSEIDDAMPNDPVTLQPKKTVTTKHKPQPQPTEQEKAENPWTYGFSEWYAYKRRAELGKPLSSEGVEKGSYALIWCPTQTLHATPKLHAVGFDKRTYRGHMFVVESVNADGSIKISDMNGVEAFGLVGTRTIPAAEVGAYKYIY